MAFQSVPETAEIDIIFTYNNVICQNVHYARLPGGYTLTDLQAMADAIDLVWPVTIVNDVPAEVVYLRTEVRGLEFINDQVAEQALSTGPGTDPGAPLPNNVTFAIKKGSGKTGRSARGRTYWIGIPRSKLDPLDENLLDSLYVTGLVNNVIAIKNSINSVGLWEAVIVSRFSEGVKRTTGVTFPWITTGFTDLRVDTIRGRLPSA